MQNRNHIQVVIVLVFTLATSLGFAAERERLIVEADGHPLTVWLKRAKNERAVVLLLHGRTWSSLPNFDLQVPGESLSFMDGLNERGITAYALDARGYGATNRDDTGWLTPDRAATDVATVLGYISSHGVISDHRDKPHLFGWSYGAMVAQLVVQKAPDIAASVTLFGYPFNPDRHLPSPDDRDPVTPLRAINTESAAGSDFILPGAISARAIATYVDAALAADPVRVDFKGLNEWRRLDAASIRTPMLVIHGEADPLTLLSQQSNLMTGARSARKRWIVLPGGAHAALLESSRQEMLNAVAEFVLADAP